MGSRALTVTGALVAIAGVAVLAGLAWNAVLRVRGWPVGSGRVSRVS